MQKMTFTWKETIYIYKEIRQRVLHSGCLRPNLPIFRPFGDFLGLLICSNYMAQDFHTQDAEKYSKTNVYKNLDTIKRNMDYTV